MRFGRRGLVGTEPEAQYACTSRTNTNRGSAAHLLTTAIGSQVDAASILDAGVDNASRCDVAPVLLDLAERAVADREERGAEAALAQIAHDAGQLSVLSRWPSSIASSSWPHPPGRR
jgi:hypothetical protein